VSDLIWHKGAPPHVGWWNASTHKDPDIWRWWDGERWTAGRYYKAPPEFAAVDEVGRASCPGGIEWTHAYPENARVPRIDPRGEK